MNCNVSWDSNNRVVSIKRANKTPESDKNKYYSNISIKVPTYTYVTGIPLSDIDTENGILYVYNNYNQDAISVYLSSLTECYGFTENEISSEDGFVFFLFSNKHIEVCVGVSELHQIVGIIVSENINSNKVNIDESLKNENKIDNNKVNEVRSSINNINNEINKIKSDIRQYEQRISDINDEIKNLRKTLNNVSQERNVRVFQNGTWVWVPDENKTQLIKDEINELQLELDLYKDLLDEAEETLSKLEDEKDGLEKELRSN